MAFDLKKDWPAVAGGGAALVGVVLLARGGGEVGGVKPLVTGVASADYQAAVAGQVAMQQSRNQSYAALFSTLVSGMVRHEEIEAALVGTRLQSQVQLAAIDAQLKAIQAQTQAQLRAAELQAATERQRSTLGLIGTIASAIIGLFCWETTAQAERGRAGASVRLWEGYPRAALAVGRAAA